MPQCRDLLREVLSVWCVGLGASRAAAYVAICPFLRELVLP